MRRHWNQQQRQGLYLMSKKEGSYVVALDTETTGLDPWHGSKPFMVNIALESGDVLAWEWKVDPDTRQVRVIDRDREEIQEVLDDCSIIVMQNSKFDTRMLSTIGIQIDWNKVHDTLIAAHIINSSEPHGLTYLALRYLQEDIQPLEDAIKEACVAARREAKKLDWRIAQQDLPDMPSAKGTVWKNDLWIPKQLADTLDYPQEHPWRTVVQEYAYMDPVITLALYNQFSKLIQERNLEALYLQRLKLVPIAYRMEENGVTYNTERIQELIRDYQEGAKRSNRVCREIARTYDYDLEISDKGSNNKSLNEFCFEVLKLPVVAKTKKGAPSLSKTAVEKYQTTLSPRSKPRRFVENLSSMRKRGTAISYMKSYDKFSLEVQVGWRILHPSINLTGTKTLRNSSKNPNEQNISKQEGFNLRKGFGPRPGREWWSLDYNNLELRIPAYECEEPAMLELFEKPQDPPFYGSYHLLIFSLLYPDLFKKHGAKVKDLYKSTLYQYTKNGNFAELYGAVDTGDGNSTADKAFHYPGAQKIVAKKLKKKAALNKHWVDFANKHGYVTTLPDKTVDPNQGYPIYCVRSPWGGISPTIPLNYHVQGTACWIKLQAMIKVQSYLDRINQTSKEKYLMIMEVHDELVFDFPYKPNKRNLPKINKIRRLMESCGDDVGIPLTSGVDYHPNHWGESL